MAPMTQTKSPLGEILNALIELDYRAVSTYDSAAERIANPFYRRQLRQFCEDHQHHIMAIKPHSEKLNDVVASESGVGEVLMRGKVALANWIGDHALLTALLELEEETTAAVSKALQHPEMEASLRAVLMKISQDEADHKSWLERVIDPDSLAGAAVEA